MGTILQDRNTAVSGELGSRAGMVPVGIQVSRRGSKLESYRMQMVNDRSLSPLLVQMAVYSTIDATERTVGASTLRIRGQIQLDGITAPIKLDNMYAADAGSAMSASLA